MDFLLQTILNFIPKKTKKTPSGWISFNAPCCDNRGHKKDTRNRGGLNISSDTISYHCFNCGFKCSWKKSYTLSKKFQNFLKWIDVPDDVINKIILDLLRNKDTDVGTKNQKNSFVKFSKVDLSDEFIPLDEDNPKHVSIITYMHNRNLKISDANFLVNDHINLRNRLIIPFTYNKEIVGYTARSCNNKTPKYITSSQPGFLFGLDKQTTDKSFIILCEGVIDALYIEGVSLLGSEISTSQLTLLKSYNKRIIVIPDRDKSGYKLLESSLDLGLEISLPNWDKEINDIGDAVNKYGRLLTLYSIIQAANNNHLKIKLGAKKWFI